MWRPASVWRRDTMVWMGWYLSAVGIGVGIGHVGWHVSVVLVIMSACPIALLVHVGVVCVMLWNRVEMVGIVVCSSCLTRACGAIG